MARTLTSSDAVALAAIVKASRDSAPVARVRDETPDGVVYGTARSIGDECGASLGDRGDIRDAWLRVTLDTGFEAFWPIAALLPEIKAGSFVVNYSKTR